MDLPERPPLIRKPTAAGSFYPANPVELTKTIAGLFAESQRMPLAGRPVALIAPHSGYAYSGKVAAKAFKQLQGEHYDTVVIVSPAHSGFFSGVSVFDGDGYQTPIGTIDIDKELAAQIASLSPSVYLSNQGHATGTARGEHTLEVLLPFLQIVLGSFKLIPIVMGDQESSAGRQLGDILGSVLAGKNCLLIASTDLSHFHTEKEARKLDTVISQAIEQYDPASLLTSLDSGKTEACGGTAVAAVLIASRKLGGGTVTMLDYATSGSVTGQFDDVVGYLSAAIVASPQPSETVLASGVSIRPKDIFELSADDRRMLRDTAAKAIELRLDGRNFSPEPIDRLEVEFGLFAVMTVAGERREQYGRLRPGMPILQASAEIASAAAFDDPRYLPITRSDYELVSFALYLVSRLNRVRDLADIEIGRHGLMIKLDMHSALLMPYEAPEHSWTRAEFAEAVCLKAGLPKQSWLERGAELYSFTIVEC